MLNGRKGPVGSARAPSPVQVKSLKGWPNVDEKRKRRKEQTGLSEKTLSMLKRKGRSDNKNWGKRGGGEDS